jgi:hypothetical protein
MTNDAGERQSLIREVFGDMKPPGLPGGVHEQHLDAHERYIGRSLTAKFIRILKKHNEGPIDYDGIRNAVRGFGYEPDELIIEKFKDGTLT